MLITHADPHGRGDGEPMGIKLRIFPGLKENAPDIEKSLKELHEVHLITHYAVNGGFYYQILNWERFQSFNAKNRGIMSRFPEVTVNHSESQRITDISLALALAYLENENYVSRDTGGKPARSRHPSEFSVNLETGEIDGITDNDIETWKEAYPAVNLNREVYAAVAWLQANPKNRKKNIRRFITNWLARSQERGSR